MRPLAGHEHFRDHEFEILFVLYLVRLLVLALCGVWFRRIKFFVRTMVGDGVSSGMALVHVATAGSFDTTQRDWSFESQLEIFLESLVFTCA